MLPAHLPSSSSPAPLAPDQLLADVVELPRHLIARPFKDHVPASWEARQRIASGDGPDWIGLSGSVWMRVTRTGIEYTDGEHLIDRP